MEFPMTTEPRVHSAGWWPTKGSAAVTNPHEPIVRVAGFYDSKCLACHVTRGMRTSRDHPGKPFPVGHNHSGHLPHATCRNHQHAPPFTDHRIQIAREGELFPG